jgi:D-serine deaminase-like pyridoxal phosphate-dependent protein
MNWMGRSKYGCIDTPALLIDYDLVMENLCYMQEKADRYKVNLRPHTKTHKMPELAKLQVNTGACGITVAKVGEAEVMAEYGLQDIFIANEIVGTAKLERIRDLNRKVKMRTGVDNEYQIDQIEEVFQDEPKKLEVLIEVEVGENRSGVITDEQLIKLAGYIKGKKGISLKGVFSHEGHSYKAKDVAECRKIALESQQRTLRAANLLQDLGFAIDTVSIGATPSLMHSDIIEGITEIRPGTYIFMDVGQGSAINDFSRCAATILTSVISKPTEERIVLDAGAKALTSQTRMGGICETSGYGLVKNSDNVRLSGVYDEHGLIYNKEYSNYIELGDKIEVIPNHICPACNLYEIAYLVSNGEVLREIPILCRGKIR